MGIFNASIFNNAIFNTSSVVDNGWLGGGANEHWGDPYTRKQEIHVEQVKIENNLIDLKKQAQELRLKELAAERNKERKAQKQLIQLQADIQALHALIAFETHRLQMLDDEQTMLVLMLAYPYLNFGGGMYM